MNNKSAHEDLGSDKSLPCLHYWVVSPGSTPKVALEEMFERKKQQLVELYETVFHDLYGASLSTEQMPAFLEWWFADTDQMLLADFRLGKYPNIEVGNMDSEKRVVHSPERWGFSESDIMLLLLSKVDPNIHPDLSIEHWIERQRDGYGNTALHFAAFHGKMDDLDQMLEKTGPRGWLFKNKKGKRVLSDLFEGREKKGFLSRKNVERFFEYTLMDSETFLEVLLIWVNGLGSLSSQKSGSWDKSLHDVLGGALNEETLDASVKTCLIKGLKKWPNQALQVEKLIDSVTVIDWKNELKSAYLEARLEPSTLHVGSFKKRL